MENPIELMLLQQIISHRAFDGERSLCFTFSFPNRH